jgi:transcriptional regulator with XRE-family HTH domain
MTDAERDSTAPLEALPDDAAEALHNRQALGARLRATRRRQRMTLKEVATKAGISESFLSQVERGLAGASVATLQRVATTLGVMVADLFEPDQVLRPRVVRHERRSMMNFGGARNYLLTPRPLGNIEVFWTELDPGQATSETPFTHGDSEEVVVVVAGEVDVTVAGASYHLRTGDSITYSSAVPHTCRNNGAAVAEVLFVVSPPSM